MITNYRRNRMGTVSFDAKFPGMRKSQDFIVYPMHDPAPCVRIQSDTRIGRVDLTTGEVTLSKSHASGAYQPHLAEATHVATLDAAALLVFKAQIAATAGSKVGTSGVFTTDNSGAYRVLGV